MCTRYICMRVCECLSSVHVCCGFSLDLTDLKMVYTTWVKDDVSIQYTSILRELCWAGTSEVLLSDSAPFG